MDNFEGGSHGESDNSQQLKDLKSNKIVGQNDQIIIYKESSNSTIVAANTHNRLTSTISPLQSLNLQCLHATVITILCLRCLYGNISTIIYLLSLSQAYLSVSLRNEFLRPSLLVPLRSGTIQSSLLTSLQRKFVIASLVASL